MRGDEAWALQLEAELKRAGRFRGSFSKSVPAPQDVHVAVDQVRLTAQGYRHAGLSQPLRVRLTLSSNRRPLHGCAWLWTWHGGVVQRAVQPPSIDSDEPVIEDEAGP